MYSDFDLLGNDCLRCTSFSAKFVGFFVSNFFVVLGHVTCRSSVTIARG